MLISGQAEWKRQGVGSAVHQEHENHEKRLGNRLLKVESMAAVDNFHSFSAVYQL